MQPFRLDPARFRPRLSTALSSKRAGRRLRSPRMRAAHSQSSSARRQPASHRRRGQGRRRAARRRRAGPDAGPRAPLRSVVPRKPTALGRVRRRRRRRRARCDVERPGGDAALVRRARVRERLGVNPRPALRRRRSEAARPSRICGSRVGESVASYARDEIGLAAPAWTHEPSARTWRRSHLASMPPKRASAHSPHASRRAVDSVSRSPLVARALRSAWLDALMDRGVASPAPSTRELRCAGVWLVAGERITGGRHHDRSTPRKS